MQSKRPQHGETFGGSDRVCLVTFEFFLSLRSAERKHFRCLTSIVIRE